MGPQGSEWCRGWLGTGGWCCHPTLRRCDCPTRRSPVLTQRVVLPLVVPAQRTAIPGSGTDTVYGTTGVRYGWYCHGLGLTQRMTLPGDARKRAGCRKGKGSEVLRIGMSTDNLTHKKRRKSKTPELVFCVSFQKPERAI
eukprot:1782199-Rhodomonas_salina.1